MLKKLYVKPQFKICDQIKQTFFTNSFKCNVNLLNFKFFDGKSLIIHLIHKLLRTDPIHCSWECVDRWIRVSRQRLTIKANLHFQWVKEVVKIFNFSIKTSNLIIWPFNTIKLTEKIPLWIELHYHQTVEYPSCLSIIPIQIVFYQ